VEHHIHPYDFRGCQFMDAKHLPITSVIPQLQKILRDHLVVLLTAEPGAGKTTQVPLALLNEPWLNTKKIIMLEPRRLATRAAATHMARLFGESVGDTVGYRTRLDTKIGSTTKIEVVTEGILTRILQHDPSLTEYGLVIFDEFHERNLQADLGLALTLQTQSLFREDLHLLMMSATLDTRTLSQQLKEAPVLTCEGKLFPIETRYSGSFEKREFAQQVAKTIQHLLKTETGNILVFLPGAGEIRRVEEHLAGLSFQQDTLIAPLYGNLSAKAQDQAILPPPIGQRKVVLSTNIAETSLTIEGIRIVLDSGLMRVPRFDVRSGMSRLVTISISQQSAEQRRGRAGRLEPGLCIRCWSESTQRTLSLRTSPEILDTDLTSLALELSLWGIHHPRELSWLDPPPAGAFQQAGKLLQSLGALDHNGRITPHGQQMAILPLHPRLAHMVLKGKEETLGSLACDLAAILSEGALSKDLANPAQADLRTSVEAYYRQVKVYTTTGAIQHIQKTSRDLQRVLDITNSSCLEPPQIEKIGLLIGLAYPDRIAQRQSDGKRQYKLANGRLASFHQPDSLEHEDYLVIIDLDGRQPISRIYRAAPISYSDLVVYYHDFIQPQEKVTWDDQTESVIARRERRLGSLILGENRLHEPDSDLVIKALLTGIRNKGLSCLPWTKDRRNWQARVQFLHRVMPPETNWPDVSNEILLNTLETWLAPYLIDISSLSSLRRMDMTWPLLAHLSPEQQRTLDTLAPTHFTVPTGSHIALDYESSEIPTLAVRLQEMFGLTATPCVANGQVPVLIHLLSPARRPVQVTQDLKSFWKNGYPEVKKELKGRYPKHFWPDDPLQAPPTRGIKKRRPIIKQSH
jgi:ATP-dependent helicase HrpB